MPKDNIENAIKRGVEGKGATNLEAVRSPSHPPYPSFHLFIHQITHSSINSSTYPSTHPPTHSNRSNTKALAPAPQPSSSKHSPTTAR